MAELSVPAGVGRARHYKVEFGNVNARRGSRCAAIAAMEESLTPRSTCFMSNQFLIAVGIVIQRLPPVGTCISPVHEPSSSTEFPPYSPRTFLRKFLSVRSINERGDGSNLPAIRKEGVLRYSLSF